jgi:tripartite-type tricarboxylate transporter receptor subunit TctC
MFSSVVAIVPQIKVGRLYALAVTGKKRIALLPDLQTLAESGVAGYEAGSWYGVLVPAGTPRAIVNKLNAHIVAALDQPSVRDQLINEGAEPIGGAPEEFAAHISAELVRMRKLISAGRMQME